MSLPVEKELYHTIPSSVIPSGGNRSRNKIDDSPVRYEVVRMMLDNMTYDQITKNLRIYFGMECGENTLLAFKKDWLPYYKELIDKWDKARYPALIIKLSSEVQERTKDLIQEVTEIQALVNIVDERIRLIRDDEESRSANYEKVLNDFIRTKAQLMERVTRLTGSSGMEERLKDVIKQTAMAAQRTLIPYLKEEEKAKAFSLFEQEIMDVLTNLEAGFLS